MEPELETDAKNGERKSRDFRLFRLIIPKIVFKHSLFSNLLCFQTFFVFKHPLFHYCICWPTFSPQINGTQTRFFPKKKKRDNERKRGRKRMFDLCSARLGSFARNEFHCLVRLWISNLRDHHIGRIMTDAFFTTFADFLALAMATNNSKVDRYKNPTHNQNAGKSIGQSCWKKWIRIKIMLCK